VGVRGGPGTWADAEADAAGTGAATSLVAEVGGEVPIVTADGGGLGEPEVPVATGG
jgi:hypothetical protein